VLKGCATVAEFVQCHLPELPHAVRRRWHRDYKLPLALCRVLSQHVATVEFLDAAVSAALADDDDDGKIDAAGPTTTTTTMTTMTTRAKPTAATTALLTANLLANELFGLVKKHFVYPDQVDHQNGGTTTGSSSSDDMSMETSHVTPRQLGTVVRMVQEGLVSNTMAKTLLSILYEYPKDTCPRRVAAERRWTLIVDATQLQQLCLDVMAQHPDEVRVYHRGGKFVTKMLKLFTGKAMAESRGQAHPERLAEVLAECLAHSTVQPLSQPEPPTPLLPHTTTSKP
jgi:Asp-tRNA(Asn)/Glu-tRNA(Gln) amidotransferase B subunit